MTKTTLLTRAVIRLSPADDSEDVRAFLQGLVTQDMSAVRPGVPQWSALLSAQGKVLFDFILWADGAHDILIDCEADIADTLAKRLTLYRLRRKIAIAVDGNMHVHWAANGDQGSTDPRLSALGCRWLSDDVSDHSAETAESADADWRAHRLSLGVTEGRAELGSDQTLWLECNAAELHGVSFTKGCYVGQENTARMNYRQKVNRRLVVVPLGSADEKRQRIAYPELGLSVEHRRVVDMDAAQVPAWLKAALR